MYYTIVILLFRDTKKKLHLDATFQNYENLKGLEVATRSNFVSFSLFVFSLFACDLERVDISCLNMDNTHWLVDIINCEPMPMYNGDGSIIGAVKWIYRSGRVNQGLIKRSNETILNSVDRRRFDGIRTKKSTQTTVVTYRQSANHKTICNGWSVVL